MCPRGSDSRSRLRAAPEQSRVPRGSGSRSRLGAALGPPRVPAAQAPAPDSGQHRGRHVPPRLGAAMCHLGSAGCKQISYADPAIMIFIGAGMPVSSKALRDKGCSARSQGM
jgi:hypothetical protein